MSDGIKGNAKIKILPLILIFFKPLRKMYEKKNDRKIGVLWIIVWELS